MESYRHQSSSFEDLPQVANVAGQMLATMVLMVVILTIVTIYAIKEIYRVYKRHGGGNTQAAGYLAAAAALFGLALLVSVVLGVVGQTSIAGPVAACSFLMFVLAIEWIDHWVASKDPRELYAGQSINEVLQRPWWSTQAA